MERLQVFASNEKFDKVSVKAATYDGEMYDEVIDEDFKEHTFAMRGIKKNKTGKQLAERIVTVTTIP